MIMFTNGSQVMVDLCAKTFMVAKECMVFPRNLQFIGCKFEPVCFNASALAIVESIAKQVLNRKLHIMGCVKVLEAAQW